MVRVKDLEASIALYKLLGLEETRRMDSEKGRFTHLFMAPPDQPECLVELTYNWGGDDWWREFVLTEDPAAFAARAASNSVTQSGNQEDFRCASSGQLCPQSSRSYEAQRKACVDGSCIARHF